MVRAEIRGTAFQADGTARAKALRPAWPLEEGGRKPVRLE